MTNEKWYLLTPKKLLSNRDLWWLKKCKLDPNTFWIKHVFHYSTIISSKRKLSPKNLRFSLRVSVVREQDVNNLCQLMSTPSTAVLFAHVQIRVFNRVYIFGQ